MEITYVPRIMEKLEGCSLKAGLLPLCCMHVRPVSLPCCMHVGPGTVLVSLPLCCMHVGLGTRGASAW